MAETKKATTKTAKKAAKKAAKASPVVATQTCRISHKAGSTMVYQGTAYPADHPAVKAQPDLFDKDMSPHAEYVATAGRRGVERATAGPGEKRG